MSQKPSFILWVDGGTSEEEERDISLVLSGDHCGAPVAGHGSEAIHAGQSQARGVGTMGSVGKKLVRLCLASGEERFGGAAEPHRADLSSRFLESSCGGICKALGKL